MSTLLAIDASTELASVALLRHDTSILFRESFGANTHSQTLLPMVQSVLADAGITLAHCSAIAFGQGPGSFTGVRTACGVVQGLAFGASLPVLPVVTLQAMAEACRLESLESIRTHGERANVLAILDARMGEVYWAHYHFHVGHWHTVVAPSLSRPEEVHSQAEGFEGPLMVVGNALSVYSQRLPSHLLSAGLTTNTAHLPHATSVARCGQLAWTRGESVSADAAQPFYLRNKVALTTQERQKRPSA